MRSKIDFGVVQSIARELFAAHEDPLDETTAYGSPALKIRGKLLACIPVNKSAEPDSLAVRIDFDRRAELLEAAPDVYYVTDHYADSPMVLVRLSRIQPDALRDLLGMARRFVIAAVPAKRALRKPKPRRA